MHLSGGSSPLDLDDADLIVTCVMWHQHVVRRAACYETPTPNKHAPLVGSFAFLRQSLCSIYVMGERMAHGETNTPPLHSASHLSTTVT